MSTLIARAPKPVKANIKLIIPAGQAKPAPPVGPALGQAGLNIMGFCKDFNAKTADIQPGVPIPIRITAYEDKTYEWEMRTPPVTYFIKQLTGLDKCSERPGHSAVGKLTLKEIYAIAEIKRKDDPYIKLDAFCRMVMGTARSMGVEVVKER